MAQQFLEIQSGTSVPGRSSASDFGTSILIFFLHPFGRALHPSVRHQL